MLAHLLPLLSVLLVIVAWLATWRLVRRRQLPTGQALVVFAILLAIGLLAAVGYGRDHDGASGREQQLDPAAASATRAASDHPQLGWSWQAQPPVIRIVDEAETTLLVIGLAGPDASDRLRQGLRLLRQQLGPEAEPIALHLRRAPRPPLAAWCGLQQLCQSQGFRLLDDPERS